MFKKTILENGIQVVTEHIPGFRSMALGILVDASPQNEARDREGAAHLTEHLLFQGTSNRDATAIYRLMDQAGGHLGAFTSRDYTCFYATVLDDYRTYVIDLLGDMFLNSIFPEARLETEKKSVMAELLEGRDHGETYVNDMIKAMAWRDHPLGRPVTGHIESVRRIDREDIIYFFHENYLPGNMIVAAAGSVDHEDFTAQIRDAFWRMLPGNRPERNMPVPEFHGGLRLEPLAQNQSYFALGLPGLPFADPHRYEMFLMGQILGGGVSSRLFRDLREEKGLVYHISTDVHAYRQAGMLLVEGATHPENLITVISGIMDRLRGLADGSEPIDAEELWRARMHLCSHHLIDAENTHTRMSRLATQQFYFGAPLDSAEIITELERGGPGQLNDRVQDHLRGALAKAALAVTIPPKTLYGAKRRLENVIKDTASSKIR